MGKCRRVEKVTTAGEEISHDKEATGEAEHSPQPLAHITPSRALEEGGMREAKEDIPGGKGSAHGTTQAHFYLKY